MTCTNSSSASITRRGLLAGAAALSATSVFPRWLIAEAPTAQRVLVRADAEIGVVRPELHGQFAEHLGSCIYGGLWVGKNSHIENLNGYRKQAVDWLRELGVPVLRWPGGCFADDYHWREGIGPAAQRSKRVNIHWGGYVEDNSFGTHEFIGLCRLIGAEPYLAGNVGSGSPRELRDWVEYCNYPDGSSLAEERAANASPEPFRVRYWGVGNESWGCGGEMRPEEYADEFRRFAVYLHGFGEPRPFLIASGPDGNNAEWARGVLSGLRRNMPDGFAMHYYSGGADSPTNFTADEMNKQLSSFAKVEDAVIQQRALLDGYDGGRKVALLLDEWGVWDHLDQQEQVRMGRLWQQGTMRSAVAAGLGLNLFNRQADKLAMCNIAQIVNVLQSLLLTDGPDGERCVRTANYYAFSLFKPHRTQIAVRTETDGACPLGLSVSASKGGDKLVLSLVNPKSDADLSVEYELRGFTAGSGSAQILHDADWNAYNSFENPARLALKTHPVTVEKSRVQIDLPRLSVATITLQSA